MQIFDLILVEPMTNALVVLTKALFGSYGLAIIAFTIVMRFATFPLTQSQLKSSRAMTELQPQIQDLQKKYKDPQRRSEEMMKLYKEAGVNPVGCIFPMLIQFPIWIALYQSIRYTVGATPESLIDLSQRLYPWSFIRDSAPLESGFLWLNLGLPDTTMLLAILVAASTWVQQRMVTPQATDERQQSMSRMMLWMMPLMFAWFTLTVPSGLALYWVASSLVGIVTQYLYMGRKFDWRSIITMPGRSAEKRPVAKRPAEGEARPQEGAADEGGEEAEPVGVAAGGSSRKRRKKRRGRGRRKR